MIRTDLAPDVQQVLAATIDNWRRRKGQCPDPDGHRVSYGQREVSWRLGVRERVAETKPGQCSWCGYGVTR